MADTGHKALMPGVTKWPVLFVRVGLDRVELTWHTLLLATLGLAEQISNGHLLRGCGISTRLVGNCARFIFLEPWIQSANVISFCLFMWLGIRTAQ
jgi:hypothetical protein